MFKRFAKTALKGFAKKQSKPISKSQELRQKLFERHKARKKKKLRKENMKVAGVGAGITTGFGAYVGTEYLKHQRDYPETGKNR